MEITVDVFALLENVDDLINDWRHMLQENRRKLREVRGHVTEEALLKAKITRQDRRLTELRELRAELDQSAEHALGA